MAGGTTYFVDGVVKTNLPGDTCIQWYLDNDDDLADNLGWTHHSVTFLTKSEITAADQKILFRIFNTYVEICNPKLEECIMATPWCEHEGDNDMHCDHNPCGTWRSGTRYYYCNGQRDTIQAAISASNTNKTWYRLKKRTTSQGYLSTTQPYLDTEHWEKASNLKFSIVDAMFAEEIFTDKLTVSKIRGANGKFTLDENGNVTANGGTYNNIYAHGGTFNEVKIRGSLRNAFSNVVGSFDVEYNDNISVISSGGGWIDAYSIPWDVAQSGRVVHIVNYKWGSLTAEGRAEFDAPSGKYFFEDGLMKSALQVSRELITLLGYGDSSTFYGWIVVDRIDLASSRRYGHNLKALAYGTIVGTNQSASLSNYRTFDGSTLSVSRQGEGYYRLNFPNNWFASAYRDLGIILTGRGFAYNAESPLKGSIRNVASTYVDIDVSDDSSRNDGSVDFLIYNRYDFEILI